ncbi:DUF805 domain-containing protein [Pseudomonas chlororaphis]|uniref:DUF805 domain-containing protein n=1 Tax=Pseudomonas chlororaphis TaxID=587753 RepID=UPI000F550E30|nr:DUF805 domain-containing protein [Pseudomonas chlororaphis]AZD47485.1 Putative molecular chaperone, DnaJ family [Pseudomonas chlororaphis subsp. aurantiaca]
MSCWIKLGIEPTTDETLIRNAYRARLPEHHPETDPEGFQALRQAYESALRLVRDNEQELEESEESEPAPAQAILDFDALLNDPARRFDPDAWQAFIKALDQLPLGLLDDLRWELFQQTANAGPLSYRCAGLLAQRMGWEHQLLELGFDQARHVEDYLNRIKAPDPFDTALMGSWSEPAQTESLWFARSLDFIFDRRPLHEYEDFASQHTCLPLPNDAVFIKRLLVQFTQAGIGGQGLLQLCIEQQREAPDDVDWLYLLACQNSLLGLDDQALPCWVRLWQEHRHPKAESQLLALCAKRQPDFLPLLIQAFDRLEPFSDWSTDLTHVTQEYGSPSQRPETLIRWLGVGRLELQGLAQAFIDWRMSGDELPLLAQLLGQNTDTRLLRLYRHAWALHRGAADLLQQVLDEPQPLDALEALVLSGFKDQAGQHLRWLNQAPIPLAMKAFIDEGAASAQLADALTTGEPHQICRLWLRRLRPYGHVALERIAESFELSDTDAASDLSELNLLLQLSQRGIVLPPPGTGEALWHWYAHTLFLLALLEQPERWWQLIDSQCLARLALNPSHPLGRLQPQLAQLQREQGDLSALLGWLQLDDPVHAMLDRQLLGVQEALDSARLLSNERLFACLRSDLPAFADDLLGRMLLSGVLYHDPVIDAQQRRYLLDRITEITNPQDWFDGFRHGLIKGEPPRPPHQTLAEDEGIDSEAFYLALDVLKGLVRYGSAGVPRQKVLLRMQRAKDNPEHGLGLRFAFSALLSWSERLLLAKGDSRPTPATAFWRLGTRLGRGAFFWQVLGAVLVTPLAALFSGTSLSAIVVSLLGTVFLLGAMLRRLHDIGRGIPTLLVLGGLSVFFPFLALILFAFPGDKLPNRYGVPPDSAAEDALPGGLQACLRRLDG